jgi:sec-independent protein translocase protein TatC
MRRADQLADPEDLFADTRMSFGDHIEELRTHLIRAIVGFVIGLLLSFLFGKTVFHLITAPVERQLMAFYNRRVERIARELQQGDPRATELNQFQGVPVRIKVADFREALRKVGLQVPPGAAGNADAEDWLELPFEIRPLEFAIATQKAQQQVGRPPQLSTMNVMEAFMVYFKVCALSGIVLSSPWVFFQIWSFVAAGLYPHEKRYVHYYLPVSLGLFLAGVLMCEFLVIPKAIDALLWFNEWLGLEPDLRLNEWLSFAIILPLVFGVSFQTPLVMLFLAKIGILDADSFRSKRRIAWFAMAAFAAIITPIDALSMILLWVPMCLLYELGILLVQYTAPASETDQETPAPEEMVEV